MTFDVVNSPRMPFIDNSFLMMIRSMRQTGAVEKCGSLPAGCDLIMPEAHRRKEVDGVSGQDYDDRTPDAPAGARGRLLRPARSISPFAKRMVMPSALPRIGISWRLALIFS